MPTTPTNHEFCGFPALTAVRYTLLPNIIDLESLKGIKMKRFALALALLASTTPFALAQASTWSADSAHSEVDFTVKHLSISNVHGRFGNVKATIHYNDKDVTKSTVEATIDTTTVNTGEAARDNHLKTEDFFNVAQFPTATFTSTSVAKTATGLKVSGNLTLRGVTKAVVLDVTTSAPVESPMDHKQHAGFEASTTISRIAYGIGAKFPEAVLSDAIKLTIELEVVKQ